MCLQTYVWTQKKSYRYEYLFRKNFPINKPLESVILQAQSKKRAVPVDILLECVK
jgi:hypothetical protein